MAVKDAAAEDAAAGKPAFQYFRVRSSHPIDNKRTLFRSISERRTRQWLMSHVPRGEEAYLQKPDGSTESYSAERQGPFGEDMEPWQPFDPETWVPPTEQEPPGQSAWGDVEG